MLRKVKLSPIGFEIKVNFDFPFYEWEHLGYQTFMISLLRTLEIRKFHAGEMILNELEECNEMTFVQSGRYAIGYEINKLKMFRL